MSVVRTMANLLAYQVMTWLVSFLFLIIGPRRLGDDAMGALGYAIAYVGIFTLVASLGTSTVLVRDIAREPLSLSHLAVNALVLKAIVALIVPVLGIAVAWGIGNRGDRMLLILLGFAAMTFMTIGEVVVAALNGIEVITRPAFLSVVQVYIGNGLGVIAILLGYDVITYGVITVIAAFVPTVALLLMVRSHLHRPFNIDVATWRYLFRAGIPLMTLTVLNVVYGTIDVPILGTINDDATVGWYTVAYRWVGIPIFITVVVVTAYMPRLSAHGWPMTEHFVHYVNQAVRIVMLAGLPCAVGLAMVADDLGHLVFKPSFYPSIVLIRILALHIPLAGIDTILATALIAANRQRRYLFVALAAAVVNPIACVPLIHWASARFDNGAIGAAIATVATELFIMIGALRLRPAGVLDRAATGNLVRIVAAGLAMLPALFLAEDLPLAVQVAIGAAVYPVALIAFRGVTIAELRTIAAGFLRSRGGGVPEPVK